MPLNIPEENNKEIGSSNSENNDPGNTNNSKDGNNIRKNRYGNAKVPTENVSKFISKSTCTKFWQLHKMFTKKMTMDSLLQRFAVVLEKLQANIGNVLAFTEWGY